jgi:putative oxidoreductase
MNARSLSAPFRSSETSRAKAVNWQRLGTLYARVALGSAFLSAVASRLGIWERSLGLKHFANFLQYAAQVLSFLPPVAIPYFAWAATACETTLGVLLVLGFWPRWTAIASAILLAMFGISMAISFGLQSPLDYSVFSASGAAVLLALRVPKNQLRPDKNFNLEEQR